jgi:DNA-binding transcriptional LysR family regulator
MIELAALKVFITAAEESSFSRAAGRLHLSQSAVSQNIQSLERLFGVELFIRHGRSVWLSEAGQALLPLAREVLDASRLMEEAMNNIQAQIAGEMVIGCSTTSGKYLLPNLVARFCREYPSVRVKIDVTSREDVITRLQNGRLSIGVVSIHAENGEIEYQPFFEDHVILIVPPDHPWGSYGKALPADLLDQPLIMRETSAGTSQVLLEGLARHGISQDMLNIVLEIANSEAIEMAVEEGIGIAFISELAAARGLALGRIKKVEVEGLDLRRTIYLVRNLRTPLSRCQDRFWSYVRDHRVELAERILHKVAEPGLNSKR